MHLTNKFHQRVNIGESALQRQYSNLHQILILQLPHSLRNHTQYMVHCFRTPVQFSQYTEQLQSFISFQFFHLEEIHVEVGEDCSFGGELSVVPVEGFQEGYYLVEG